MNEWLSFGFIGLGALFFFAGTVGLLRFPDVYTRLHALTKADNMGLGLITLGLVFQTETRMAVLKLLLTWGLVMLSSAASCHLIARAALRAGVRPWRKQ
jgi:multicomponent Na+:H+ antiporter subunit G